jgi:hypothetical protein
MAGKVTIVYRSAGRRPRRLFTHQRLVGTPSPATTQASPPIQMAGAGDPPGPSRSTGRALHDLGVKPRRIDG